MSEGGRKRKRKGGREEGRKGGRLGRGMGRSLVGHRETNTGIPSTPSLRGDDLHACEWGERQEEREGREGGGEGREEKTGEERRMVW